MTLQDIKNRGVTWFQKWRKPIFARPGDREPLPCADSDNLVEEWFVRLQHFSEQPLVEDPQNFIYLLASYVAKELHKLDLIPPPREGETQLENMLARIRMAARRQAALDRLPAHQREILQLKE